MSDPAGSEPQRVLLEARAVQAGRRRVAPRAEESSDVTRFRGLSAATLVGAAATLVALVAAPGGATLRAPGPLSRPHRIAGLECATCHAHDPPTRACAGCHGAHPSTRAAHRALAGGGELGCASCHTVHRGEQGVTLLPTGEVLRWGAGGEQPVPLDLATRAARAVTVPLIPAGACARCHDPRAPADPIAACLIGGQARLGDEQPTVCFDEHRVPAAAPTAAARVVATAARDAAWEAAREVAALAPLAPEPSAGGPPIWIAAGAFGAAIGLGALRLLARRRRPEPEPALPVQPSAVVRLPRVDTSTCIGCRACVDACPYDVLEMRGYVAAVARPLDCCGLTLCEQRCPNGSLVVAEGDRLEDRPLLSASLESVDVPGVWIAGDLGGPALIRNAITQGAQAVRAIAASLGSETARAEADVDLAIVGAGPAGISAALESKARGLSYVVVEQGSVAESIRSFPRGKLVLDQTIGLPLVGELWLEQSSKEELLGKWLRIVRRERLLVREGERVIGIRRGAEARFELTTRDRDGREASLHARRLLLAIGRRGSPRRLPASIDDAALDRVHYALADAQSFAGCRIVVVGLGDVAMETILALARQPGASITLVHRGEGFRRGKARNVEAVRRLLEAGRVRPHWNTVVERVERDAVHLAGPERPVPEPFDALFVMIGSVPAWDLLQSAGIRRPAGEPERGAGRQAP